MNDSRIEYKVGLFVVVGVGLLALLILNFSKGITLFNPVYKLRVILPNAAGLKPAADVMMAGVPIGKVSSMELAPDEKTVDITVSILGKYKIRKDAKFHIDALGFLGDQYVSISTPEDMGLAVTNQPGYFQNGDTVTGEPTFNMLEAVQSISSVIGQAKKLMIDIDQAVTNVNASALSTNTLAHFALAVNNLELVSEKAVGAASTAENLLSANTVPIDSAVSNFQALSVRLTDTAAELGQIVATNREDVTRVIGNLTVASDQFKQIALDLQAGKGPAGILLKDPRMTAEVASVVSNADNLTAQFAEFGRNLNERGIWAMLWRPKHRGTNSPPAR
jgi:phospholipid/cholesterol/gamma-HCH transport system substrate-binding protein